MDCRPQASFPGKSTGVGWVFSSSLGAFPPRGELPVSRTGGQALATGPLGKPPTAARAVFANLCVFLKCHGDSAGPAGPVAWGAVQAPEPDSAWTHGTVFQVYHAGPHGTIAVPTALPSVVASVPLVLGRLTPGSAGWGRSCWDGALGWDHQLLLAITWAIVSRVGGLCQASLCKVTRFILSYES